MKNWIKITVYALALVLWSGGMFVAGAYTFNVRAHVKNSAGTSWIALPLDASGNLKIALQ